MYSCRLLSVFIGLHCILILYHVYISPLAIYISDTPPDWSVVFPIFTSLQQLQQVFSKVKFSCYAILDCRSILCSVSIRIKWHLYIQTNNSVVAANLAIIKL